MNAYREIQACRVSGSTQLISVLNLGHQTLTGVFPKKPEQEITKGRPTVWEIHPITRVDILKAADAGD